MKPLNKRQEALVEIISHQEVSKQEELIALLESQYGIVSTQAMLSRDLKLLGCVKKMKKKKRVYALPVLDTQQEILRLAVREIVSNEVMIVIHTGPALAHFVAEVIDQQEMDIIGTIAGENVVFVTPKSTKLIKNIIDKLNKLINLL